jgi:hypothetical protein
MGLVKNCGVSQVFSNIWAEKCKINEKIFLKRD